MSKLFIKVSLKGVAQWWKQILSKSSLNVVDIFLETATLTKMMYSKPILPKVSWHKQKSSSYLTYFWSQKHHETSK